MGMVLVALFAANGVGPPEATIRSTFRRTNSAASSGSRSSFCSANRYSMVMFFLSVHPSLLSSCRNASKKTALPEAVLLSRKPMRKIFPGCCASAGRQSAKSIAQRVKTGIFFFMSFSLSRIDLSLDHSTLARAHLITLSALASIFGGIVKPICFAAFRLMMNSKFFGCSTGKSAGLTPLRILST